MNHSEKDVSYFCGMKKSILVVDDEQDIVEILEFNLKTKGFQVQVAYSAEEALMKMRNNTFDLLLLDVMMPGMSGFDLAKRLKGSVPIIFITAKDAEDDMLAGFGLGADDYIAKPFSLREVQARVNAVLHRTMEPEKNSKDYLRYHGMEMDLVAKTLVVDGTQVPLTKTEFALLSLLLRHFGKVFTRQQLINIIWPPDVIVTDRTVDVNINRIRKKVGVYSANIITRQGFGYSFDRIEKE